MHLMLPAVLMLLAVSPVQDQGKKSPPSVAPYKYLQIDAGQPDKTGWFPARSTNDGFTISMPAKFSEYTQTFPNADGDKFTLTFLKAENKDVKFIVISTKMLSGTLKKDPLDNTNFERNGKVTHKKDLKIAEWKGVEFRFENTRQRAMVRKYASDKVLFQLLVEAPAKLDFPTIEKDAKQFLESFALQQDQKDK